jgi:hypothetical protein
MTAAVLEIARFHQPHGAAAKREVFAGDGSEADYCEKTF